MHESYSGRHRRRPVARSSRFAAAAAVGACLCAGQLVAGSPASAAPAALTAPALALAPATGVTQTAAAALPTQTAAALPVLSIRNQRPTVRYGQRMGVVARAVDPSTGRPYQGRAIVQRATTGGFRAIKVVRIPPSGLIRFGERPSTTSRYRIVVPVPRSGTTVYPATAAVRVVVRTNAARVISVAKSLTGRPYVFGAAGPRAFDCSGFTQYVYRKAIGRSLPHLAHAQQRYGRAVAKSAARPGDLIIFRHGTHGYHVGIYAGGGYMYDSPKPGARVAKRKIWSSAYIVRRLV